MDDNFRADGDLRAGSWGLFARGAAADDFDVEACGGRDFNYPVSYTHLDVYKRQAQKVDPATHLYSKTMHIASFAGIAPVNNPAIAVAVVIDLSLIHI